MSIPRELIDTDAQKVIQRLVRYSHQAYLVGGCVRDLLLDRTPKDFDIATSATPSEIKDIFRNCRIIGRRFRLAHIFFGSKIIETSTFRANPRDGQVNPEEEDPSDLLIRRDNVFGSAEEDAQRRDFTINGLFYDLDAEMVIDYVGGLADLQARVLRTIGEADIRFREDPVRILRAIKFAARLDFVIEPAAYQAVLAHRGEIPKCAAPRVLEEIYRLLRGGAACRSVALLDETGVLELLVPELAQRLHGERGDVFWRALDVLDATQSVRPTEVTANAVLLCALIGPLLGPAVIDDSARTDIAAMFDERLRPLLERMHVSRRDAERARQLLLMQRRLWSSRRRRRPGALSQREDFAEALQVFVLLGQLYVGPDRVAEELSRWQRLGPDSGRDATAEPAVAADGRRRRRRRGGRRHRLAGNATAAPPAEPEHSLIAPAEH